MNEAPKHKRARQAWMKYFENLEAWQAGRGLTIPIIPKQRVDDRDAHKGWGKIYTALQEKHGRKSYPEEKRNKFINGINHLSMSANSREYMTKNDYNRLGHTILRNAYNAETLTNVTTAKAYRRKQFINDLERRAGVQIGNQFGRTPMARLAPGGGGQRSAMENARAVTPFLAMLTMAAYIVPYIVKKFKFAEKKLKNTNTKTTNTKTNINIKNLAVWNNVADSLHGFLTEVPLEKELLDKNEMRRTLAQNDLWTNNILMKANMEAFVCLRDHLDYYHDSIEKDAAGLANALKKHPINQFSVNDQIIINNFHTFYSRFKKARKTIDTIINQVLVLMKPYFTENIKKEANVQQRYRKATKNAHPNRPGGSNEKFHQLTQARQAALLYLLTQQRPK